MTEHNIIRPHIERVDLETIIETPTIQLPKKTGAESNPAPEAKSSSATTIQSSTDFWRISGVEYRDGVYDMYLAKALLDGGNAKTQDEWIDYSKEAQAKGEFYTGDMPLHYATFTGAYKLPDSPMKEEIRAFLKKHLSERLLTTTTRIHYQPQGKTDDVIVHNRNMPNEYKVIEPFVFPDEYVKNCTRASNYKALIGTDNLQEIQNVFQWITEKDAYLWRVNNRLDKVEECVAGFWAGSGRAGFGCDGDPSFRDASLGVFSCAEGAREKIGGT